MFKIKKIAGVVSAVAVTSVLTAGSAFAAIDVTPLNDSLTDVSSVGAAIMSIFVAIAGFKYIRKLF